MNKKIKVNVPNILNKSLELDKEGFDSLIELITAAKVVLIHDYDSSMNDTDINTNIVSKQLVDLIEKKENGNE